MKNFIITFLMLIGFSVAIYAQETVTVTGTVTDTNGEPMIGVNITVKDMPGMGTIVLKWKLITNYYSHISVMRM